LQALVLFGGEGAGYYLTGSGWTVPVLNDTWEFHNGSWSQIATTRAPPVRWAAQMAFDGRDGYLLLFGGNATSYYQWAYHGVPLKLRNDTWQFSNGTWTQVTPTKSPSVRTEAALVELGKTGVMVLFGGETYENSRWYSLGDTWRFAGGVWKNVSKHSGASPSKRSAAAMAYDPAVGAIVLFGGVTGTGYGAPASSDTWQYENGTWTNITYAQSPPGRSQAALVYDGQSKQLLLWGGLTNGSYPYYRYPGEDIWVLD
jgi:hypothetical protein